MLRHIILISHMPATPFAAFATLRRRRFMPCHIVSLTPDMLLHATLPEVAVDDTPRLLAPPGCVYAHLFYAAAA